MRTSNSICVISEWHELEHECLACINGYKLVRPSIQILISQLSHQLARDSRFKAFVPQRCVLCYNKLSIIISMLGIMNDNKVGIGCHGDLPPLPRHLLPNNTSLLFGWWLYGFGVQRSILLYAPGDTVYTSRQYPRGLFPHHAKRA